ncbi:cysteine-rich motor neuron 1 protein-like [Leptodactylus fuscus]
MTLVLFLLFIFPYFFQPAQSAYNCTACEKRTCPPMINPCPGSEAIDPCGCCRHCAKQYGELCGGTDWEYGYCDSDYKCAPINGTGLVDIPNIGVCKDVPGYRRATHYAEDDDENCPEHTGCFKVMGMCDCPTKRTCVPDFQLSHYIPLYCNPMYDDPYYDNVVQALYEKMHNKPCTRSGCDIVDNDCKCESSGLEQLCANVTCPEVVPLTCPRDSVATKPHTPYRQCCPTIPSQCTCNFKLCNDKCPRGKRKTIIWKSDGAPGRCCDKILCLL